jgi:hypothetical protein
MNTISLTGDVYMYNSSSGIHVNIGVRQRLVIFVDVVLIADYSVCAPVALCKYLLPAP